MSDATTTIEEMKAKVRAFSEEREWQPYHSLKNLSMALSIEVSELMEHFQWVEGKDARALLDDEAKRTAIEEELADVVIYCLQFANGAEIDLSQAIRRKMEINAQKYPVEKARSSSNKYDEF